MNTTARTSNNNSRKGNVTTSYNNEYDFDSYAKAEARNRAVVGIILVVVVALVIFAVSHM